MPITLKRPEMALLAAYVDALERDWSPDNIRGRAAADEQLARIRTDPEAFLAAFEDPEGRGPAVTLPDGSQVQRLPGIVRWIWDGSFCGSISVRWPKDRGPLPAHVLGHIGFAVVPWKRGQGAARAALGLMLAHARAHGLAFVELTTTPDNIASQRTMLANGAVLQGAFDEPAAYGGRPALRFRIDL